MKLTLDPFAGLPGAPETVAAVAGDVLTVDGTAYDLSAVPEGGEATPEGSDHPFVGTITRTGGVIAAHILAVYGADAARDQPADPAHWTLTVTDGPVPMPFVKASTSEEQPA